MEIVDENLYWITNKPSDLEELEILADASLQLEVKKNEAEKMIVSVKNMGSETAFFIRLKVWDKNTNQIVLPVFSVITTLPFFLMNKKKSTLIFRSCPMNSSRMPIPFFKPKHGKEKRSKYLFGA